MLQTLWDDVQEQRRLRIALSSGKRILCLVSSCLFCLAYLTIWEYYTFTVYMCLVAFFFSERGHIQDAQTPNLSVLIIAACVLCHAIEVSIPTFATVLTGWYAVERVSSLFSKCGMYGVTVWVISILSDPVMDVITHYHILYEVIYTHLLH